MILYHVKVELRNEKKYFHALYLSINTLFKEYDKRDVSYDLIFIKNDIELRSYSEEEFLSLFK